MADQNTETAATRDDRHNPNAPFRTEWRPSGPFTGFLAIYSIGGVSGYEYLDYLLSRDEATQLYAALGAVLSIAPQPAPGDAVTEAAVRATLTEWECPHKPEPRTGVEVSVGFEQSLVVRMCLSCAGYMQRDLEHEQRSIRRLLDAGASEVRG